MRYISTRGEAPAVGFLDAMLAGMAPDGGLYMPEQWPRLSEDALREAGTLSYAALAAEVLKLFAGDDLDAETCVALCEHAYSAEAWANNAITPLKQYEQGAWFLELFHGPSLSFKDVAMQLIAQLYDHALAGRDQRLSVVCATSGDTGGAAVEALKRSERVDLFVLTPKGRVSDVQRRFMSTSGAANVFALEVDTDFDGCQAIVKSMFADAPFAQRVRLSAVNSINWARIVAQSVYYVAAASALRSEGGVCFVAPTGNFGDAFSGSVAKQLGAPIKLIQVATNTNAIVSRAIQNGSYQRAEKSIATLSPAMDIQVASNFERLMFEALGRDGERVRRLYQQFAQSGAFEIPDDALNHITDVYAGTSANDAETQRGMSEAAEHGALICPHTSVGFATRFERNPGEQWVMLATAHPAKFPETFETATGIKPILPTRCADLFERAEKVDTLPADIDAVKQFIRERSRAWS